MLYNEKYQTIYALKYYENHMLFLLQLDYKLWSSILGKLTTLSKNI